MSKVRTWFVVLAALGIVAAACGNDETPSGGSGGAIEPPKTFTTIGEPEDSLELIAWAGYVEDGTSEGGEDFDWVTPFEDATGCQVNVTYGDTSDEMVTLMRQGGGTVYDGVSASGDASVRLIAGGDVGAIDTSLFPQFANVIGPLNPDGACTATGHVREVVYLGALTRYIVTLDVGGELVVMQQNLATSSMEALQVRGKAVRLVWDRKNNRPVDAAGGSMEGSEDPGEDAS